MGYVGAITPDSHLDSNYPQEQFFVGSSASNVVGDPHILRRFQKDRQTFLAYIFCSINAWVHGL